MATWTDGACVGSDSREVDERGPTWGFLLHFERGKMNLKRWHCRLNIRCEAG